MTMVDKIHTLERLGMIDRFDVWDDMRKIRNHIAHEYPDHPELNAIYLNQVYDLAPKLLATLERMKTYVMERAGRD